MNAEHGKIWEPAEGGMERCRIARGWIYRFLITEPVEVGAGYDEDPVAVGITFVPDPEAS
ncbi:MAG TPA: hypothetical protein VFG76_11630 [Candidatus Polarisedimenticolia bacterium]|nr:hypothetical protein [Candidatus Polarisedimenticolia bacterium]